MRYGRNQLHPDLGTERTIISWLLSVVRGEFDLAVTRLRHAALFKELYSRILVEEQM